MNIEAKIVFLEQLLGQCYKTDNIHYMDWNQLDWHLKVGGHKKLTSVNSTHDDNYGYIVWDGDSYEFLLREGTKFFSIEKFETKSLMTATEFMTSMKAIDNINRRK